MTHNFGGGFIPHRNPLPVDNVQIHRSWQPAALPTARGFSEHKGKGKMRSTSKFFFSVQSIQRNLITILFVVLFASALVSCSNLNAPRYEETECQFYTESSIEIECGILKVPEDRDQEDSPMIELHFAILRSSNPDKAPDPVVFLQGGPGGYALDMMDYFILYIMRPILYFRDVIVLDQRGVGYSQPSLNCPELEEPFYAYYAQDLSMVEQDERFLQSLQSCRDRLVQEGVDLNAYTSAANAADVDDLRRALGYSDWNLYGSSYGTRLALTVMRDFPEGVRSVILDAVFPPHLDLFASWVVNMERALNLLFERCAEDVECNQANPELEQVFYEVVDQVDAQPVTLSLDRPKDLEAYEIVINGGRLIRAFYDLLYRTDELPRLPKLIYEIHAGDWDNFGRMIRWSQFGNDGYSEGMRFSVWCAEEMPFSSPEEAQTANAVVNPRVSAALNYMVDYQSCAVWEVTPTSAVENQPVVSDIATLILEGEHDPIHPPPWGMLAAETLSQAQYLEFPGVGHGVLGSSRCSREVVEAFLAAPDEPVDASCVAEMPPLFGGD